MNNPTITPQVVNSPFGNFCMSIGAIPTSYKDSLDYYETLLWLIKFLDETVIPAVTTNGNAVAELQNLYIELKDYVEHYFENLDVQEEINNKLDDMVEQGILQEIIADYLNSKAIFGFDNVESLKEATNLIDGSYAETLGYYEINDGGGATYKIREITNDDVVDNATIIPLSDDNLIAELIVNDYIIPEQFGAHGDGITDDFEYLINTINYSLSRKINIIGNKNYLINNTLTIDSNVNLRINKITYTGNDTAILIKGKNNIINIEYINSTGSAIRLTPTKTQTCDKNDITINFIDSVLNGIELIAEDWGILDNIFKFNRINTTNGHYGIYCYAEHNPQSTHVAYIGEIGFYCGRVSGGTYAVYAKSIGDSPSAMCEITALKFFNLSLEGSENGIYFDNVNFCIVDYPRYQELATNDNIPKIFTLKNNTRSCIFNCTSPIAIPNIDVSDLTNNDYISNEINCPIRIIYKGSINGKNAKCNKNGLFYEPLYKYVQQTIGASITSVDLRIREVLPTYIRSNATGDLIIYLNENYNPYGMCDLYLFKVESTGKIDIYASDGETRLLTLQANQTGHFHLGFNQEGYLVSI